MLGSIPPRNVALVKNWVYIVQPGDTLASITTRLSGNPNRYYELVGANPQKIKIPAPTGFRYHFFKDLVEGEKLKVPGNWRSKESVFGIGVSVSQFMNPGDLINQFGGVGDLLNQWYTANTNTPGITLPAGLSQQVINQVADLIIAWQPYVGTPVSSMDPSAIITTLLSGVASDPSYQALITQFVSLFNQAVSFLNLTSTNPISSTILNTIPWSSIPWGSLNTIIPAFNQAVSGGGFYDWLSQIKGTSANTYIQYTQTQVPNMVSGLGNGIPQQNVFNPGDINGVDPTVLNQIPWDKIGNIDWVAAAAAIQKWGVGTPADIQATKACWDKCVVDINQATVDDFFHDVNSDHGCCRWKCATNQGCPGAPQPTTQCDANTPCPTGYTCVNGVCVQNVPIPPAPQCDSSHQCNSGYDCINSVCVQHGQPAPLPLPTGYHCPTGSTWDSVSGNCKDNKGNIVQAVKDEVQPTPPKDNTVLYVIAGLVGVLIIGGTIIAVSGKEKSAEKSTPTPATSSV